MRRPAAFFRTAVATLVALASAGCARVPAGRVTLDRLDYGQVIAESWKRQTLLNVVRLRYSDAPVFLDVSSVINTYSIAGSVSAGAQLQAKQFPDTVSLGTEGIWSNTPTVTYQPLMGDRFTRSLLQPVTPAAVMQLIQGGWPPDLVLRTVVRSINGVRNDSFGVGGDPQFREIVDILSRLQREGGLGNRVEARKDSSAVILVLRRENMGSGPNADARALQKMLGFEENIDEVEVVYGLAPRSRREVAMITRSMLEIILELGAGVELSPAQAGSGRALPGRRQAGDAEVAPLVRIRSGATEPEDTYAKVRYRDLWYWIADNDIASKRIFTFLLILFSLAETGQSPAAPVVTVPSR